MGFPGSTLIEVSSHRSEVGCWRSAQRLADSRLRDYVLGYFASESSLPQPVREHHLPSCEVAIVLNFAAPHRIIDPANPTGASEHRHAWVVGLQHRRHIREAFGDRDFMVIRCSPIGAHLLLGVPMDLLTDRILALEDLDRQWSRLLTSHASATADWAARFRIVERLLAARLASAPAPPTRLLRSWRMLQEVPNSVDLARLPEEFGCSRRHLIAQFHKYVGMAPKTVVRISRFHMALSAMDRLRHGGPAVRPEGQPYLDREPGEIHSARSTPVRWTDLALSCGYYDQSHLINDFKAFSELSPLQFLRLTRDA